MEAAAASSNAGYNAKRFAFQILVILVTSDYVRHFLSASALP